MLWRGDPGWFLRGSNRNAKYSGAGSTFTAALSYGGVPLSLSYEPTRRTAVVQGTSVSLLDQANVILVDNVDRVPMVSGGSTEILSFARCEAGTDDEEANRRLRALMCDDLKK